MSLFNNVKARMTETGQVAMQKARTVSETAKLNVQIGDLQKSVQETYTQIGELYFKLHADAPEEALAELVDAVRQANDQIAQCQDAIAKLSNAKTCPACGAVLGDGAAFCSACGAAIPKDEPAEPDTARCPKCGRPVAPGAAFCSNCGFRLDEPAGAVCSTCGAALTPGNRFCTSCGTPVPEALSSGPDGSEDAQG